MIKAADNLFYYSSKSLDNSHRTTRLMEVLDVKGATKCIWNKPADTENKIDESC